MMQHAALPENYHADPLPVQLSRALYLPALLGVCITCPGFVLLSLYGARVDEVAPTIAHGVAQSLPVAVVIALSRIPGLLSIATLYVFMALIAVAFTQGAVVRELRAFPVLGDYISAVLGYRAFDALVRGCGSPTALEDPDSKIARELSSEVGRVFVRMSQRIRSGEDLATVLSHELRLDNASCADLYTAQAGVGIDAAFQVFRGRRRPPQEQAAR